MQLVTVVWLFAFLHCWTRLDSVAQTSDTSCHLQLECTGTTETGPGRVRIPVRSARGPIGPTGERGLTGPPGPQGPAVTSSRTVGIPSEYQIAFYAGLTESIETKPTTKDCPLIFDAVVLNLGGGYNATTGQFTAPVAGVYVFVLVLSAQSYEKAGARLIHNGTPVLLSWCESTFWATVTNQVILKLDKGDKVWLQCREEAYHLHGHMYSNLSGYLIYPATN
ncbi:Complement C1q tumor necrosis factor- protein 3 [Clonorchis sinensis]|uniref:Complement C1q tumor necrosis factor-related protein 3 n=2 Tax=Clonorchis sinensis TaxID=79923 RepID=G7YAS6_CLOSI|nr:Complement C1q tumor necrosis factor- protein 3 [Clonorchis sinensis]GAA50060.1 complement C1q tumor necrosis factor-related protein 3 [Clonorchis sinensis]